MVNMPMETMYPAKGCITIIIGWSLIESTNDIYIQKYCPIQDATTKYDTHIVDNCQSINTSCIYHYAITNDDV